MQTDYVFQVFEGLGGGEGPVTKGLEKKLAVGFCQSDGLALPHKGLPVIGGRGETKTGAVGAPHGARLSPIADRLEAPHPCPTTDAEFPRRGGAMTSSSSGDNAEEPSMPLGLGVRRLGESEPDPVVSPVGRAIGAIGRATGPGSPMEARLAGPGGIMGGGELSGPGGILDGGPIGVDADGMPPRKVESNGGPAPKLRGTAEGAKGGGGGP